jgi:hypothetical protein
MKSYFAEGEKRELVVGDVSSASRVCLTSVTLFKIKKEKVGVTGEIATNGVFIHYRAGQGSSTAF